jgi:hypothetical protein
MSTKKRLQEPILDGGVSSINYFNGRLLNAGDLTRERVAHREVDQRLGRALGDGVAYGLEVRLSPHSQPQSPALQIDAGLAINRNGQALSLGSPITLELLRPSVRTATGPASFTDYTTSSSGTYIAGQGVYLLTIAPIESRVGRAPVSGLGNEGSSCNADSVIDGVQFRLIQVDSSLIIEELRDESRLRNRLAYRCFGVTQVNEFLRNPFGPPLERYGLLDELRESVLSDSDVPLALLYWKAGGVSSVDMWAVRRRLTQHQVTSRWSAFVSDRRLSESEAMFLQFQEHVEVSDPKSIAAEDGFIFLPPVGSFQIKLPVSSRSVDMANVFSNIKFFSGVSLSQVSLLDAAQYRNLIIQSFSQEAIDIRRVSNLQVYLLWENLRSVELGIATQLIIVFASSSLPSVASPRYGYAYWGLSRTASTMI